MSSEFRTRFAPSPTGLLHLGHAFAARQAFEAAKAANGVCLLRIEDIDQTRCRPEYEAEIYRDLRWLGFDWPEPVRRQSEHFEAYQRALDALNARGVIYRCFLTRKALNEELDRRDIAESPAGERPWPGPQHELSADEEAARLEKGEAFAWRLSLKRCRDLLGEAFSGLGFEERGNDGAIQKGWTKANPEWLGDVVLARKDTPTSYHLSVCHDDALQAITDVVRGADLYYATHIHVLLQALMDWPVPVYHHHRLMLDASGKKFSKSDRSKTLRAFREDGVRPDVLLQEYCL